MMILSLCMLLFTVTAYGAGVDVSENAAPLYREAWAEFPAPYSEPARAIGRLADSVSENEWRLTDDERDLIALCRAPLRAIANASRRERCDFELDYSLGPKLTLPHIGYSRLTARLIAIETRLCLDQNDRADAIEWLAVAIRHNVHLAADGTMVGSMAALQNMQLVQQLTERIQRDRPLSEAERDVIRAAMSRIDMDDPFNARAAVLNEGERMAEWIVQKSNTPQGVQELYEFLESLVTLNGEDVLEESRIRFGLKIQTSGGWNAATAGVRKASMDLSSAWDAASPHDAFDAIAEKLRRGDYGALAPLVAPSVTRLYDQQQRVLAWLKNIEANE